MKKRLIIIAITAIVLTASVVSFIDFSNTPSQVFLIPKNMLGGQITVYDVTNSRNLDARIPETERGIIDEFNFTINLEKLRDIEARIEGANDVQSAIMKTLSRHNFTPQEFNLSTVYNDFDNRSPYFDLTTEGYRGPIAMNIYSKEVPSKLEADLRVFKNISKETYFAIASNYREFDYSENKVQGYRTIVSSSALARESSSPELTGDFKCVFASRIFHGGIKEDIFDCGNKSYLWVVLDKVNETSSHNIVVREECSVGSLWQQFSCKYLR